MEDPITQPVVCPIVVGRTTELTALRLLVDRTKGGSGQVLLLHGEVGIGKSRLIAEVKAAAVDQGFLLLPGNCFQGLLKNSSRSNSSLKNRKRCLHFATH